jgi:hypothetical protein
MNSGSSAAKVFHKRWAYMGLAPYLKLDFKIKRTFKPWTRDGSAW